MSGSLVLRRTPEDRERVRRNANAYVARQRQNPEYAEKMTAYRAANKDKISGYRKTYRNKNLEKLRDLHLRRLYNITLVEYNALLESQQQCCAICKTVEPGANAKHFHVDHDHTTGRVRGLLCANCNHGIGKFADDAERLRCAAAYLERV